MKKPYTKSGKCGNKVYQRARHGQISYAYYIPANPRTPDQVEVRGDFGAFAARWRRLTQDQRNAWKTLTRTQRSRYRLGSGPLSGFSVYMRVNIERAYWGMPPADLPPPRPKWPLLGVSGFSIPNVAGTIKLLLKCSGDPGNWTVLRASAPASASRKSCTKFKIIGLCPVPVNGVADITGLYVAKFGLPPVEARIFLHVNQMIDGWQDKPVRFKALVLPPPA